MKKNKFLLLVCLLGALISIGAGSPAEAGNAYRKTIESYSVPDVVLVNQDGKKVRLKSYLETDQPVILDFIYGTCTTICPVLSAGFTNLQKKLGPDAGKARLVSITIDPEHDTPRVMKEYLKRYHALPGWDFLTGTRADIDLVMKAFNAYIPDKMSHYQLMLIRSPHDGKWTRIKELISSADLLAEFGKANSR